MDTTELFCEILAQDTPVSAADYTRFPGLDALVNCGLLKSAGVAQSILCMDCETPHSAEIVHQDGRYGYFCPDVGFVPVAPNDIAAIEADLAMTVDALADAFECHARKSARIAGTTWRVGKVRIAAGDVAIYFHPLLRSDKNAADVSAALSREVGARYRLILTADGTSPVTGSVTALLSDVVEVDLIKPAFRPIAELRDIVGAARTNLGGAPNRFGDKLTLLIKKRIADEIALDGRNAEARAVLAEFRHANPHLKAPTLSSVQDYVTKVRTGQ